ncbi:hypothetical protein N665_2022s0009, partial [Sinapis alba]
DFRAFALIGAGVTGLLSFSTVASADEAEHGLDDRFPQPYSNESAARFAYGGAYPPDLSLITEARHNGQNYVFALLTGYRDPPAGILIKLLPTFIASGFLLQLIREGLHYNPYFPGEAIAMPKMLNDEAVEYEDGTPATEAQVTEPEMEERKLMGFKWIFLLSLALLQAAYYRRLKWSVLKSRKLVLDIWTRATARVLTFIFI